MCGVLKAECCVSVLSCFLHIYMTIAQVTYMHTGPLVYEAVLLYFILFVCVYIFFNFSFSFSLLLFLMVCTRGNSDYRSGQVLGPTFSILMIISIIVFVSHCK